VEQKGVKQAPVVIYKQPVLAKKKKVDENRKDEDAFFTT
jgi:hypothetical protein